jgi:hypothetical protein
LEGELADGDEDDSVWAQAVGCGLLDVFDEILGFGEVDV